MANTHLLNNHRFPLFAGLCCGFLLLLMSASVVAQASAPDNYSFGRLFTSNTERRALDSMRESSLVYGRDLQQSQNTRPPPLKPTVKVPQHTPEAILFSGFILRDDGHAQSWLNGGDAAALSPSVRVGQPSRRSLTTPLRVDRQTLRIKPGQVLLLDKKRVVESYTHTAPAEIKKQNSNNVPNGEDPDLRKNNEEAQ